MDIIKRKLMMVTIGTLRVNWHPECSQNHIIQGALHQIFILLVTQEQKYGTRGSSTAARVLIIAIINNKCILQYIFVFCCMGKVMVQIILPGSLQRLPDQEE